MTEQLISLAFKSLPKALLVLAVLLSSSTNIAQADTRTSKGQIKRQVRALVRGEVKNRSNTNFPGGWRGTFQLNASSCPGLPIQVPFTHVVFLAGNRARIVTSHDGTLFGTSRDKGRRLEVARQYTVNGVLITVGVGYARLQGNVAASALAVEIRGRSQICRAVYTATARRDF